MATSKITIIIEDGRTPQILFEGNVRGYHINLARQWLRKEYFEWAKRRRKMEDAKLKEVHNG